MGTHIHHIIPKHMGGTNDPSNLVELSIEDHAEAHRKLYEQHGHWEDKLAWKSLSGQISSDEIRRAKAKMIRTGAKLSEETKEKIRKASKNQKNRNHNPWTEESREKQRKAHLGKKLSDEHKQNISAGCAGIKKPKLTCPHCNKVGGAPQMIQWHFDNCKTRHKNQNIL